MTSPSAASVTAAQEIVHQWTGITRLDSTDTNYSRLVNAIAAALEEGRDGL